jgi:hypothetical protein
MKNAKKIKTIISVGSIAILAVLPSFLSTSCSNANKLAMVDLSTLPGMPTTNPYKFEYESTDTMQTDIFNVLKNRTLRNDILNYLRNDGSAITESDYTLFLTNYAQIESSDT